MLRKLYTTIIALLVCSMASAQMVEILDENTFGKTIAATFAPPSGDYLCVYFRDHNEKRWANKGTFSVIRPDTKEVLWTSKIDYTNTYLLCTDKGILKVSMNKTWSQTGESYTTLLNPQTGKKVWRRRLLPTLVENSLDVLVGYLSPMHSLVLTYQISTGKLLTEKERTIPKSLGCDWANVLKVDSTKRLFISDGVNILDLKRHYLLRHEARTGITHSGRSLALGLGALGGIASAAFVGIGVIPISYGWDIIGNTHSNVLSTDSCYYFADRDKFSCLANVLHECWSVKLPSRTVGTSLLTGHDQQVHMVNLGYGMLAGTKKTTCGKPFIASFDTEKQQMRYLRYLTEKKDSAQDAAVVANQAYIVFSDRIVRQPNLADSLVLFSEWDIAKNGRLTGIEHDTIYICQPDSQTFAPLYNDEHHILVRNQQNDIYLLAPDLTPASHYTAQQVFRCATEHNGYKLLRNRHETYLIDPDNKRVRHFGFRVWTPVIAGEKIYAVGAIK